ncbi:MAG: Clp protease N-terminal domain-containing protein [Actinobacteria bacterium]|nr:Clp protease N-terminal domain-containing protein [Actinomycetota bacterium]
MGSLEMSKAAFAEAKRLGHSWVGPEHGLLAILQGDPADVARRAVEEAGLDSEQFERFYVERVARSDQKPKRDPEREGISPNPAWYGVVGRAEGFASTLGTGEVRPLDLLVALLWDNREWLPIRASVSPERPSWRP